MGLVTDYILPEGAAFCKGYKWRAPTSIRFLDGTIIPYKFYTVWRDMMRRAEWRTASKKADVSTYENCKVSDKFHSYSDFYEWAKVQYGFNKLDSNGKLFTIEKDILSKSSGYYPETTVFVPLTINNFFSKNRQSRYLRGARPQPTSKKFCAFISINSYPLKYLGQFDTELEAHLCWCKHKEAHGRELAQTYKDYIDPRVYERLMNFDAHKEFG